MDYKDLVIDVMKNNKQDVFETSTWTAIDKIKFNLNKNDKNEIISFVNNEFSSTEIRSKKAAKILSIIDPLLLQRTNNFKIDEKNMLSLFDKYESNYIVGSFVVNKFDENISDRRIYEKVYNEIRNSNSKLYDGIDGDLSVAYALTNNILSIMDKNKIPPYLSKEITNIVHNHEIKKPQNKRVFDAFFLKKLQAIIPCYKNLSKLKCNSIDPNFANTSFWSSSINKNDIGRIEYAHGLLFYGNKISLQNTDISSDRYIANRPWMTIFTLNNDFKKICNLSRGKDYALNLRSIDFNALDYIEVESSLLKLMKENKNDTIK